MFNKDFQKVAEVEVEYDCRYYLLPVMKTHRGSMKAMDQDAPIQSSIVVRRFNIIGELPPTDEEYVRHYKTGRSYGSPRYAFLEE